jgi:CelD/BcsL family acetyltransferase involved in cellulose biosynthesis
MTIMLKPVPQPPERETPTPPAPLEPTPGLQIRVLAGGSLGAELTQAWSAIQQADPALESPFFRPEYTQAVAAVRDDVFVAAVFRQDEPVAFFPYQRSRWGMGSPVGGPLTDYQGIIARPDVVLQPRQLLRTLGLAAWRFDHVPATQHAFAPFRLLEAESPRIDLSQGVAHYLAQRGKSNDVYQTERLTRKIQREVGPLRLETDVRDLAILNQLIEWKSEQYRQTRTPNIFRYPWVNQLIQRMLLCRDREFSVTFTTLRVGDDVLAMLLSLRCGGIFHSWMTSYNRQYARFSPGRMLHLELIKAAPALGIHTIDLGRGHEPYKQSFANDAVPLCEGICERRPVTRWLRRRWLQAREWVRESPYRDAIRVPWSWVRPLRDWVKYR